MITIKTIPSKYFFTGDVRLSPGKEVTVDLVKLTETQLLDIIEAETTRVLVVSDIETVKKRYRELRGEDTFNDTALNKRLGDVEVTLENLTVGEVASVTYWKSTEW